MTEKSPSNMPLVLMLVWYGFLLIGTGGLFLLGLMFASESYRGRPMPITEWLIIGAPVLVSAALIGVTIWLWNAQRRSTAIALCLVSVAAALAAVIFSSGLAL